MLKSIVNTNDCLLYHTRKLSSLQVAMNIRKEHNNNTLL